MIIGFDIGGTKVSGIVWDGKKVVKDIKLLTPKTMSEFKITLKEMALFLNQSKKAKKIGVGVAGSIDRKNGTVVNSPNLKIINGFNFKTFFKELKFQEVRVENDANCFALAEARLGQGKNFKNFIGITLGTGIGGGLISQGRIYEGMHGGAGEVGHMPADFNHSYEQLFQRARDKKNYKLLQKTLGNLFVSVTRAIDMEAIILGGSVALKESRKFLPQAMRVLKQKLKHKRLFPKVLISKQKNAGAVGAALLFEK